jgi:hypothetical protein
VHTYDAQLTLGAPQPLPDDVVLDGVEEFLSTISTTTVAWPHEPAAVDFHATEGRSWRNWLSADGARAARLSAPGTMPASAADDHLDAADASTEARPMSWSLPSMAAFRWTPYSSTETDVSSTSSWPGTRSGRTAQGGRCGSLDSMS